MLKFVIWGALLMGSLVLANMLVPLPFGFVAQRKWSQRFLEAVARRELIADAMPRQSAVAFVYGILSGISVALLFVSATWRWVGTHRLYQIFLIMGFLVSGGARKLYLGKVRGPGVFGPAGDKFCALMFGGYFWGALLCVVGMNIKRLFFS